jgi:hypothetical protein
MPVFLEVWLYYSLREGVYLCTMNPSRIANKLRGECSYHTSIRVVLSTKKLSIKLCNAGMYTPTTGGRSSQLLCYPFTVVILEIANKRRRDPVKKTFLPVVSLFSLPCIQISATDRLFVVYVQRRHCAWDVCVAKTVAFLILDSLQKKYLCQSLAWQCRL